MGFLALALAACDAGEPGDAGATEGDSTSSDSEGAGTNTPSGTSTTNPSGGSSTDPTVDPSGTSGETDSATTSDTDPTVGTNDTIDPSDTDDSSDTTAGGECDVYTQDCPDGEKCTPWADDGGNSWNATKCAPVDATPGQVGDPCVVEGSGVSGIDNCDVGTMCYYVSAETSSGTCVGLCEGNAAAPSCDNGFQCATYNDGVLPLCLEECDPLQQDCSGGEQLCVASPANDGFVCILDSLPDSAGIYGAPCEFANACDPGLFCANQAIVPGCTNGGGCCSEFCDVSVGNPDAQCSGAGSGQTCQLWWNGGPPAPGYENVGYCGIPQ